MIIIGIDPGIKGAICILKDGKILDVFDMPIMPVGKKNKSQVNGSQIYNEIKKATINEEKTNIKVVIEQVSAMPGQGVTSMFNFGQSFGVLMKGLGSSLPSEGCSGIPPPRLSIRPSRHRSGNPP